MRDSMGTNGKRTDTNLLNVLSLDLEYMCGLCVW